MSTDFETILAKLNIETAPSDHHHSRAGWLNFDCPYCGSGTAKYHMGYNLNRGDFSCWKCGPHRAFETLKLLGLNGKESVDFLQTRRSYSITEKTKACGKLSLPKSGDLLPAHLAYLKKRRFDPEEIKTLWNVSGIGMALRLSWRILIPIYFGDRVVSWTTRAIGDGVEPRYISAQPNEEVMMHKEILYGEQYAKNSVIVHEGPIDVWTTGPGAVATCGTSYSVKQLLRLSKYPRRIICFDSESEAQKRARRLAKDLSVFDGETFVVELETGGDTAEASLKEVQQLREFAFGSDT